MKALVYQGPGEKAWENAPDPKIEAPTDAIVQITSTTICGTDLHILKGDVPEVLPGTILGHEAVGLVVETGSAVTTLTEGDRVLVSCISSCGRCRFCKEGHYGLCIGGGGWILGHTTNGVQAEFARIPFADTSLYKVPAELSDEQVLFLADILPTAYEVGVLNGGVTPGDTVAIVGAGPIGLAAILTAKLYTPDTSSRSTSSRPAWRKPSSSAPTRSSTMAFRTQSNGCSSYWRSRRRRRDRGSRRAGDVRALRRTRPSRRPGRRTWESTAIRRRFTWRSSGSRM